jgi:hypothetical protein
MIQSCSMGGRAERKNRTLQLRQRNGQRPKICARAASSPSLLERRMSVDPHFGHLSRVHRTSIAGISEASLINSTWSAREKNNMRTGNFLDSGL